MHGIGGIIGAASFVSGFPLACRSISGIVSSFRRKKRRTVIADGSNSSSEENNLPHADYLVAGCLITSPEKLSLLAKSEIANVRGRVAENPNCPVNLLSSLAQDSNPEVRLSVAYNPNVSNKLLEWLAEDECPDILFALAEDHNLATSLLAKLSQHNNPYVAERAKRTLERLSQPQKASRLGTDIARKTKAVLCHQQ